MRNHMQKTFPSYLLLAAASTFSLAIGCSSTPAQPDDTSLTSASTLNSENFAQYLPESTLGVLSIRPEATLGFLAEFGTDITTLTNLPLEDQTVLSDLILASDLVGADRVHPTYVAVTAIGNETLLRHARHGAPMPTVGGEDPNLSRFAHVRVIAPALDGQALVANLLDRCTTRNASETCDEVLATQATSNMIILDLIFGQDFPVSVRGAATGNAPSEAIRTHFTTSLNNHTKNLADADDKNSAAWKMFTHNTAILSGYGQVENLYDIAALTTAAAGRRSPARTIQSLGSLLQLNSPEAAELVDVGFAVWQNGPELLFDGVSTLTEYGAAVDEASKTPTRAAASNMQLPLIDIRWSYDVAAALKAAQLPYWARVTDPAQLDAATSRRLLESGRHAGLPTLQYPTSLLRINLENGSLPPQLGNLHGMFVQLGAMGAALPQSPLELALALDFILAAGTDAQILATLANSGIIIPGSILHEERVLSQGDHQELQISVNATAADVFSDQSRELTTGAYAMADLIKIYTMLNTLGMGEDPYNPQNPANTLKKFIDRYPTLYYATNTEQGQWRARLQFGGAELNVPRALDGAKAPAKNPTRTECQYEATERSLAALQGFLTVAPDAQPSLIQSTIDELNELAKSTICQDDADTRTQIEWVVQQWQNQLPAQ